MIFPFLFKGVLGARGRSFGDYRFTPNGDVGEFVIFQSVTLGSFEKLRENSELITFPHSTRHFHADTAAFARIRVTHMPFVTTLSIHASPNTLYYFLMITLIALTFIRFLVGRWNTNTGPTIDIRTDGIITTFNFLTII